MVSRCAIHTQRVPQGKAGFRTHASADLSAPEGGPSALYSPRGDPIQRVPGAHARTSHPLPALLTPFRVAENRANGSGRLRAEESLPHVGMTHGYRPGRAVPSEESHAHRRAGSAACVSPPPCPRTPVARPANPRTGSGLYRLNP